MLYIHSGNSLEVLAEEFRREVYVKNISDDPLAVETALVQTGALGEYLTMYIAEHSGIAMNLETPFFNTFITRVFDAVFTGSLRESFRRDSDFFSASVMRWELFDIISDASKRPPELESYASEGENAALKRFQLADVLARDFEKYSLYRRETLMEWGGKKSPPSTWQEALYRRLRERHGASECYIDSFFRLEDIPLSEKIPRRVSVFGVAWMPKDQLEFFRKLSMFSEVHIFHVNPCMAFWEDIRSAAEDASYERRHGVRPEAYEGNPLLASSGARGREFFHEIMDISETEDVVSCDCFRPYMDCSSGALHDSASALDIIRQDILDMATRGKDASSPAVVLSPSQMNIEFHSCHTRKREVEVLHDRLMAVCENLSLSPRDILVTAPDISVYEPYIESVFSRGVFAGKFSVRDKSLRRVSATGEAFMTLLSLSSGRFAYSEVTDFVSNECVMKKFSLTQDDVNSLMTLIYESGARWGFDESSHERFCDVPFREFSWRSALDRIFEGLFFDFDPSVSAPYSSGVPEIIPYASLEGESSKTFARLVQLAESADALRAVLEREHTPEEWSEILLGVCGDFFETPRDSLSGELELLRRTIQNIAECAEKASFSSEIPLSVVKELLESALDMPPDGALFTTGGITFSSMIPQRSIPYRVIAVLGMNEGEFPKRDRWTSFELFNDVRRSDPSRQADDRFSFLLSVISASERLLIFRDGLDPVNGKERPMAPPLAEFLKVLRESFIIRDLHTGAETRFTETSHHPNAFHPDYFLPENKLSGSPYLSFSEVDYKAAKAFETPDSPPDSPPVSVREADKACDGVESEVIELDELKNFFADSCLWFVQNRAKLMLREESDSSSDVELMKPSALEVYKLMEYISGRMVIYFSESGLSSEEVAEHIRLECVRSNLIPPGGEGEKQFDAFYEHLSLITRERLENFIYGKHVSDFEYRCSSGGFICRGRVRFSDEFMTKTEYDSFSQWSHKHHVKMFLETVFASAALNREMECSSMFAKFGETIKASKYLPFTKVTPVEADALLSALCGLYRTLRNAPSPVFEHAMTAYGKNRELDEEKLIREVSRAYSNASSKVRDDYSQPWVSLCFGSDPFSDESVWETFKTVGDIFYSPPREPEDFQTRLKAFFACSGAIFKDMVKGGKL